MIDAYDKLKDFTRNNENMTIERFQKFIDDLNIDKSVKDELYSIELTNYTGLC